MLHRGCVVSFLLCMFCVVFREYLVSIQLSNDDLSMSPNYSIIVGVLSARQNFQHRIIGRQTWMKNLNNVTSAAYFVIGRQACPISPEDRLDPYSCEEWRINKSELEEKANYTLCKANVLQGNFPSKIFQGFSFRVQHPVIIECLGILTASLLNNTNVTVALLMGTTKEIVVKTQFSALHNGNDIDGYTYRTVEAFMLPKGFEGIILIEGPLSSSACVGVDWNTGGGVINMLKIYRSFKDFDSFPFKKDLPVAGSMMFRIHDIPKLQRHLLNKEQRQRNWEKEIFQTDVKLKKEFLEWKDIVFVDVVDTYRNLAPKLLKFYQWLTASKHFDYILKTDDDCLINVPVILKKLEQLGGNCWWSSFRKNWPVNYFGKWADYHYTSSVYPMFACGAGYVLSQNLVAWISNNSHHLHPYQGEDVSLGIWLAAVRPNYIDDSLWACGKKCEKDSYNLAELNLDEMLSAWKNFLRCGRLCHCDES